MNASRHFRSTATTLIIAALATVLTGCGTGQWQATKLAQIDGLHTPECAFVVPETGEVFVSNIVALEENGEGRFLAADGNGFITRLRPGGQLDDLHWVDSTEANPLNGPKGICVFRNVLYAADTDHVRRIDVKTGKMLAPVVVAGAEFLNDIATDGEGVYISDTGTGKIHRIEGDSCTTIPGPPSANGLAFAGGKMYCTSWLAHEIYEIDPTGKTAPVAFGLADKFGGLDALVILPDGQFLVSDHKDGKVDLVSADRKTVRTLFKVNAPADCGVDFNRGLLYVPLLKDGAVAIYEFRKK